MNKPENRENEGYLLNYTDNYDDTVVFDVDKDDAASLAQLPSADAADARRNAYDELRYLRNLRNIQQRVKTSPLTEFGLTVFQYSLFVLALYIVQMLPAIGILIFILGAMVSRIPMLTAERRMTEIDDDLVKYLAHNSLFYGNEDDYIFIDRIKNAKYVKKHN